MVTGQAEPEVVRKIRQMASDPQKVRRTERAKRDSVTYDVTKYEVMEAICAWIDAGKSIRKDFTRHVPEHRGTPIYTLKPDIGGKVFWVEIRIAVDSGSGEILLIISAHPSWDERRENGGQNGD